MNKLLYILYLLPLLSMGQIVPFGFFAEVAGCTDTVGDVFTTGNAASECSDEADATTGLGTQGSGAIASVAETSGGSNYVWEITSTDATASQGGKVDISGLSSAGNFDVTIKYRVTVDLGSTQAIRAWTGVTASPNFTMNDDGAWHTEVFNVTLVGSDISIKIYSTRVASSAANEVQIDYITMVET